MLVDWIEFCILPAVAGFFIDLLLGDPREILHPVVLIGRLISFFERKLLGNSVCGNDVSFETGAGVEKNCGASFEKRKDAKKDCGASFEKGKEAKKSSEISSPKETATAKNGVMSFEKRNGMEKNGEVSSEKSVVMKKNSGVALKKGENERKRWHPAERRQFAEGCVTAAAVCVISTAFPVAVIAACCALNKWIGVAAASLMCWQMYAAKGLRQESMKVYEALAADDREGARRAVSMIVGRDTSALDEEGIIKAAVETVAENTSDGVIAPMFFMTLAGPAGAYFYKSVNTMDSMIGYRNQKYEYFGKCAARLDDLLNFIPARISAILMIFAAAVCALFFKGESGRIDPARAMRIFLRDRHLHASPNSAQTESVCAGALGVKLAGPAVYFGRLHEKPFIGDAIRRIEKEDIRRANKMMYIASLAGISAVILSAGIIWIVFNLI